MRPSNSSDNPWPRRLRAGRGRRWRQGGILAFAVLAATAKAETSLDSFSQAEVVAATGVAGVFDAHHGTQTRLEYHFRDPLIWRFRPYLATGVASDGGYHVGVGLSYRKRISAAWRLLLGSGPAYYQRHDGFDLGDDLEFFSFAEFDRQLAPRHWLGLRIAHVSNASLGKNNPGREMLGIVYTRAWDDRRAAAPW